MDLSNLRPAESAVHSDNFRRGRGHGPGNGKIAGRGHRDQKVHSGTPRPGFESDQMPLCRCLPKGDSKNRNMEDIVAANVEGPEKFKNGSKVTVESPIALDIISHVRDGVKILGNGELTKRLIVEVNAVSGGAKTKIEVMGGICEAL